MTRHTEDVRRYEELLESTRDADGVCDRAEAVKLLTEELAEKEDRVLEYAKARANQVADGFDRTRAPETDNGQMALDIDTYLVIGDSERVRATVAKSQHTRQWLDVQARNHALQAAAWATKDIEGRKILRVQDERDCSFYEAYQFLNGGRS